MTHGERRLPTGLPRSLALAAVTVLVVVARADSSLPEADVTGPPMTPTAQAADTVTAIIGELPPGESVRVVFDARVDDPVPPAVNSVSIQGTVSGTNFPDVTTDDPDTGVDNDPTVTTLAVPCVPVIEPTSVTVGPGGQAGLSFDVTTHVGCSWNVTNNAPSMLTNLSSASGSGSATITYDVATNPTGLDRTGTLDVVGVDSGDGAGTGTHTVVQTATACSFTLTPTSASFPEEGGPGSVAVDASRTDCTWTAASDSDWLAVTSGAGGTGDGTVDYQVEASNWAVPRTGTLTIAGQAFTVDQAAGTCTFAISPTAVAFGLFAGTQTIAVGTGVACTWDATSNDAWISIESVDSGDGPGTVTVRVDRNETGEHRSGTATIAGETLTVTQSGDAEGAFTLSPEAVGFPGAGGSGQVQVRAPSEVGWTAVPGAGWITVTSAASGLGDGSFDYTVASNPTDAVRTATIDVSGRTFTVKQAPSGESTLGIWISEMPREGFDPGIPRGGHSLFWKVLLSDDSRGHDDGSRGGAS